MKIHESVNASVNDRNRQVYVEISGDSGLPHSWGVSFDNSGLGHSQYLGCMTVSKVTIGGEETKVIPIESLPDNIVSVVLGLHKEIDV